MKKFFLSAVALVTVFFSEAQTGDLTVKNGENGLYLEHKVAAKEGLYAIGRLYGVNPKFIAAYNKIDINKGISIDQVLRIPLTDTNFSQKENTGIPVYYRVGPGEGLLKVSDVHNKVALKSLQDWNGLTTNSLKAGTRLIVGFLVKEVAPAAIDPLVQNPQPVTADGPVAKTDPPLAAPVLIEEKKNETPEKTITPVAPVVKADVRPASAGNDFFKPYFDQQVKTNPVSTNTTVTSGIFKTTSGWQDTKYYLLIDKVSPGTIVKIINPDNNRAVYAKVLGEMNGIRQNQGLDIRISNAAASALQVTDEDKFIVKVNY